MRSLAAVAAATLILINAPGIAHSATVSDAKGDFALGYLDAAPDLDVRSFTVNYNIASQIFSLSATLDGAIDPTTSGTYVIGVNTGTGPSAPFAALGAPGVRFNQNFRINKDGSTTLGAIYTATISGSGFAIDLPASLFISTGFAPEQYGFNLWPRNGLGAGTFVTDFAPNNSTLAAAVPEPATWAMLAIGFGAVGAALRRRRWILPQVA